VYADESALVVSFGEYGGSPMRKVIGTPLQIPARSLAAASFFDLVVLLSLAPSLFVLSIPP
jgi:hypothetical protein